MRPRSNVRGDCAGRTRPLISVIITAHNEGAELRRTIASISANTKPEVQFVVVDDASTDGSCRDLAGRHIHLIRHDERMGVAFSRNAAAKLARGRVLAFFDGHQRVSAHCLDRCATLSQTENAIVTPDIGALHAGKRVAHGARFRLCPRDQFFAAAWNTGQPRRKVSKISSLRAPAYLIPADLFGRMRWIQELRGWGGSEAALSLKAFFLDGPILHLCGPLARHLFKKSFHYHVTPTEVWRNQALIARVCFDERTWYEYWLPTVFQRHLTNDILRELDAGSVVSQYEEFQKRKRRSDREFWTGLLRSVEPRILRRTSVGWRQREFRIPLRNR